MPQTYEHITGYEREVIAHMWKKGSNCSEIARELNRHPSTIWREIDRNSDPGIYCSGKANQKAQTRREVARRPRKMVGPVAARVKRGLKRYWSPDQIEGRGTFEGQGVPSMMTIYRYLETPEGAVYRAYLRGPGKARRRNRKVRERIHHRVMIDERPPEVEAKRESGHWEGDTVRGPMKTSHCVVTLVERLSQYLVARRLSDRSALELNNRVANPMRKYNMKSLTVDNGMEFASHQQLKKRTGTTIYFAHEKSPWERGLNEQVNGLLRQFFPKGTDFGQVSPAQLRRAVEKLNNRPRKTLGYKTPNEVFNDVSFALVK